jgi:hypothetical protein
MKQNRQLYRWLPVVLAGLAIPAFAQTTNNPDGFDTAAGITSWVTWWGPPNPTITWDPTLDASNNPNSGSMRYVENFTGAASEQFMTFGTLANRWQWDGGVVIDGTKYQSLDFDIKIDPSTARTTSGNYGSFEFGLVFSGWTSHDVATVTIPPSATNWTHYS